MSFVGNYRTEFDSEHSTWNTFYHNELLAVTAKAFWDIDDIPFESKAAGEALLATAAEIYGPMETIFKAAIDSDASLFKTPEGETENANPETGLPESQDECDPNMIIILKIQSLLSLAKMTKNAGGDTGDIYKRIDKLAAGPDLVKHMEGMRHKGLSHPYTPDEHNFCTHADCAKKHVKTHRPSFNQSVAA